MKNSSTKDRNASASAYGWAFQVGAGIKLMLENVKEFTALKMEGKDDDIEITLPTGKIYAQAKSVTQMGIQSTATQNLTSSLETLSDDIKNNSDSVRLIYVTNILNPVSNSKKTSSVYDRYDSIYDYSSLPPDDQKKILDLVGADFPVDQFQIHVVKFFGNGENKFDGIKESIKNFLQEALGDASLVNQLWASWYTLFSLNCTDKPKDEMSFAKEKKEIMYPVIVLAIDPPVGLEEFQKVSDYDDYSSIEMQFRNLINERAYEYEFSTPLLAEYNSQRAHISSGDRALFKYKFVQDNWQEYNDEFNHIQDADIREAVIKLTLLTIIIRASKLEKIKKAANL